MASVGRVLPVFRLLSFVFSSPLACRRESGRSRNQIRAMPHYIAIGTLWWEDGHSSTGYTATSEWLIVRFI